MQGPLGTKVTVQVTTLPFASEVVVHVSEDEFTVCITCETPPIFQLYEVTDEGLQAKVAVNVTLVAAQIVKEAGAVAGVETGFEVRLMVAASENKAIAINPDVCPVAFNLKESPAQSQTVQLVTNDPVASAVTVHAK